jgi:hypothetical protein
MLLCLASDRVEFVRPTGGGNERDEGRDDTVVRCGFSGSEHLDGPCHGSSMGMNRRPQRFLHR